MGRVCRPDADGALRCWPVGPTVKHGALSTAWTTYCNQPVHGKGTISADGTVKIALDTYKQNGKPLSGDMNGTVVDNKIAVTGARRNGVPLTATFFLSP